MAWSIDWKISTGKSNQEKIFSKSRDAEETVFSGLR